MILVNITVPIQQDMELAQEAFSRGCKEEKG